MTKRRVLTMYVKLEVNVVFFKSKLSLASISGRVGISDYSHYGVCAINPISHTFSPLNL
jgi:hypothetical protein